MCRKAGTVAAMARTCSVVKVQRIASRGSFSHLPVSRAGEVAVAQGCGTELVVSASMAASSTSGTGAASVAHGGGGSCQPSP